MEKEKVFSIINIGCPKNLVDSEAIMGIFLNACYFYTDDLEIANVIVINTCGFIKPAKRESLEAIKGVARMKAKGQKKKIIVVGCLVQLEGKRLKELIPEIDILVDINNIPHIMDMLRAYNRKQPIAELKQESEVNWIYDGYPARVLTGKPHYSYIKIAEGCNHSCSFCIIPKIKGSYRSRSIESILREAKGLAASGVKELILISQDSSYYGLDKNKNETIVDLLRELNKVEELHWIRLLYLFPDYISEELIDVIKRGRKICKYFDIPFQHCNERILRLMKRGGNKDKYLKIINNIREAIPDASIRTTMIVGFPGETQDDFNELLSFCEEVKFDNLGVFIYYDEKKAESHNLDNKVSYKEKKLRREILLKRQMELLAEKNAKNIGKVVEAVIDDIDDSKMVLRSEGMAPEIDSVIYVNRMSTSGEFNKRDFYIGQFVRTRLINFLEYDYIGEII
jgi:ribosomal protein S12 methylthiotransferase